MLIKKDLSDLDYGERTAFRGVIDVVREIPKSPLSDDAIITRWKSAFSRMGSTNSFCALYWSPLYAYAVANFRPEVAKAMASLWIKLFDSQKHTNPEAAFMLAERAVIVQSRENYVTIPGFQEAVLDRIKALDPSHRSAKYKKLLTLSLVEPIIHANRIKPRMAIEVAIRRLSNNIPASSDALTAIARAAPSVNPSAFVDPQIRGKHTWAHMGILHLADELALYDRKPALLYRDVCDENPEMAVMIIYAWKSNIVSAHTLHSSLDALAKKEGHSLDVDAICRKVQKGNPTFLPIVPVRPDDNLDDNLEARRFRTAHLVRINQL